MKISDLIFEDSITEYYHVTPEKNVPYILEAGLDPEYSDTGRIYLYKSLDDAKEATDDIHGYLSDKFPNDFLVILKIIAPKDLHIKAHESAPWEFVTTDYIPPEYISLL